MKTIGINNFEETKKTTIETLKKGGLILYPSDTVYILAVDATNQEAVNKLLGFKNRWTGKAISVAVANKEMAKEYVELDEKAVALYDKLLPGPFTIVSNGKHKTAKGIEAENGTLGIRIPGSQLILDLVKEYGKPITATSANLSGRSPHYSVESLLKTLSEKKKAMLDLIVDGGKLPKNKPSTVIDITQPEIKVLRRGDLVTGKTETLVSKSVEETERIGEFIAAKPFGTPWTTEGSYHLSLHRAQQEKRKPIIFALSGDLGCGKTVFSRAVGKYLGVKEKITSPTFFIYNEYEIRNPNPTLSLEKGKGETVIKKFLHFDLYRIRGEYELEEIKFLELFEPNTVACIEWPENMGANYLEKIKEISEYYSVNFEYVDPETREIRY